MSDYGENPDTEYEFMQDWYKKNNGCEHMHVIEDGQEPCYTSGGD
jgi:hypothetical protein